MDYTRGLQPMAREDEAFWRRRRGEPVKPGGRQVMASVLLFLKLLMRRSACQHNRIKINPDPSASFGGYIQTGKCLDCGKLFWNTYK